MQSLILQESLKTNSSSVCKFWKIPKEIVKEVKSSEPEFNKHLLKEFEELS